MEHLRNLFKISSGMDVIQRLLIRSVASIDITLNSLDIHSQKEKLGLKKSKKIQNQESITIVSQVNLYSKLLLEDQ